MRHAKYKVHNRLSQLTSYPSLFYFSLYHFFYFYFYTHPHFPSSLPPTSMQFPCNPLAAIHPPAHTNNHIRTRYLFPPPATNITFATLGIPTYLHEASASHGHCREHYTHHNTLDTRTLSSYIGLRPQIEVKLDLKKKKKKKVHLKGRKSKRTRTGDVAHLVIIKNYLPAFVTYHVGCPHYRLNWISRLLNKTNLFDILYKPMG